MKVVMLTGDARRNASGVGRDLGITDVRSELLPHQKVEALEQIMTEKKGKGKVVFVGDGINDAPALARAHAGVAMGALGSQAAIETADVALMDDDLLKIPRFIRLSRSTHTILVQNISFALGIKALFFVLAFSGHATMWMAVLADVGAALLVIANGLRARHK